jgi:hypothetical protein
MDGSEIGVATRVNELGSEAARLVIAGHYRPRSFERAFDRWCSEKTDRLDFDVALVMSKATPKGCYVEFVGTPSRTRI